MNSKQQIERHIANQVETMESWTKASPQIKERILQQDKRIAALETALGKALSRIAALEQRPTGLRSLILGK